MKRTIAFLLVLVMCLSLCACNGTEYNRAQKLMKAGQYNEAIEIFKQLDGYRDSTEMVTKCHYQIAIDLFNSGEYGNAREIFLALNNYLDCDDMVRDCDYETANTFFDKKEYSKAIEIFSSLDEWKDSRSKVQECMIAEKADTIAKYKTVGSYVLLGKYEQDNDFSNGTEPVKWIVLDYDPTTNHSLLISRYGIAARAYEPGDSQTIYPTWSKSDIRHWLNTTFKDSVFNTEEQNAIVKTKNITKYYVKAKIMYNESTDDVWILSDDESFKYFDNDKRQTTPTAYAVANGAFQSAVQQLDGTGCCSWWLRNGPPGNKRFAAYVPDSGGWGANYVNDDAYCVRPAIIVDVGRLFSER